MQCKQLSAEQIETNVFVVVHCCPKQRYETLLLWLNKSNWLVEKKHDKVVIDYDRPKIDFPSCWLVTTPV